MPSCSKSLIKRSLCLHDSSKNWRHGIPSVPVYFPWSYTSRSCFSQHTCSTKPSEVSRQVKRHFIRLYRSCWRKIVDASELSANSNSSAIAFTGSIYKSLVDGSFKRICIADYKTKTIRILSHGPGSAKTPRWSPDGQRLAFLSDSMNRDVFQVYMLDRKYTTDTTLKREIRIRGSVESISWSPDGNRLLILSADLGADQAGAYGGAQLKNALQQKPLREWMPSVVSGEQLKWRRAWIYELRTGSVKQVGASGINFWEACWLGETRVLAITSFNPTENAWYRACLVTVNIYTGIQHEVYRTERQLGVPAASPSGSHAAVIESISSDRGGVAGDIILFDTAALQHPKRLDLNGVDVTQIMWHTDTHLSYIGLRKTSTVAGRFCLATGTVEEHWDSPQTCGALYPEATITAEGSFVVVSESWNKCQELVLVGPGYCELIRSFENGGTRWLSSRIGEVKNVSWQSNDGLEIQGYLCSPLEPQEQRPLILNVHGGPVYTFRNKWQLASPLIPLLVSQGYSVLSANPRGSTGRGQDFCAKVIGDLGGGDAQDLLSGVDAMVQRGEAEAGRIGVMGVSYGGYMATWLPTQSNKFGAAVAIAPVTNFFSNHGTSNIGYFDELFLKASPYQPGGLYHARSSVMFAGKYPTPFLQITGAKDRCVSPSQALEYHAALSEAGVKTVLVTYPNEGHGIRQFRAYRDFCTRTIAFFDEHLRK